MGTRIRLDTTALHPEAQKLKDFLKSRLIGQRRAVDAVVTAYNRFLSPMNEGRSPIIAMLSMGPSGSGKTLLAELLAEYFFGDRTDLTKISCGDLGESHQLSQIIGAPPGFKGCDDTPRLAEENIYAAAMRYHTRHDKRIQELKQEIDECEKRLSQTKDPGEVAVIRGQIEEAQLRGYGILRNQVAYGSYPSAVLLFDEFEKAHQALMHFQLEVTERGRATLANGATVDLTKAFVIMTSNVASAEIARVTQGTATVGFQTSTTAEVTDQAIYERAIAAAKSRFSTEFLNRVITIVYRVLSVPELAKIRDQLIADIEERLHQNEFFVKLIMSQEAKDFLLEVSSDHPELGAREVRRKVDQHIQDKIDGALVSGGIEKNRQSKIFIELENSPNGPIIVLYREDTDDLFIDGFPEDSQ